MEILEQIKAGLKKAGIPDKYAEKVKALFGIEKEENLDNYIQLFKDNIFPDLQATDNTTQTAVLSAISDYEKRYNLKDGKPVEPSPGNSEKELELTGLSPEVQAIFKAQSKQISDLTNLVTNMTKGQVKGQKLETVRSKMKGKVDDEFLEDFAGRVNLDAENLDAEIESQIGVYNKLNQKFINKAVSEGNYVPASGTVSDNEFDNFLKTKNDKGSEFKGVEL